MSANLSEHDRHYVSGDISAAIAAALEARRQEDAPLSLAELAALDQFHTGGLEFTRALAQRATITAADHVLDVGGGIGGPARVLAQEFGCQVTVLDVTEAYCRVGEQLTELAHLSERVRFQRGDALEMPFADGRFDVVWTQHSSMNIADKARLYAQLCRVVRPGGRLALQEVCAGSGAPLHLPTMWAHTEAMNFLVAPEALRASVASAGFREVAWTDISASAMVWLQDRQRAQQSAGVAPNPLGLQLLLGAEAGALIRNHVLNLREGRIRIVEGLFERL